MLKLNAPGKLMIAGEWSVLEGNTCIVSAINKRVFVEISECKEISVSLDDFNIRKIKAVYNNEKVSWKNTNEEQTKNLIFTKSAIETALLYLENYKPFKLRSWGEESQIKIDGKNKKIGFGSSAAAVVAIIAAILEFNSIKTDKNKENIYKLAAIAHYFAQGKIGSAFDVAASTYGGIIAYNRFDSMWLLKQFESKKSVRDIVAMKWPGLKIEKLNIPNDIIIMVGWTKESASTSTMIKQMQDFKKFDPEKYNSIYGSIGKLVENLINAWKKQDRKKIFELVNENENLLKELGAESGVNIETKELKMLSEIANNAGAAGKLSGAGGGDCGIAICFDNKTADNIKSGWEKSGLYVIDALIDKNGVAVEKV
ncbi:MAG: phosphomevalonate kinase [Candidatus Aenigmatarchaeota archaeon]